MGERARYAPGEFCLVGLATSDPERAKPFYTTLFGWEAEDMAAGGAGTVTMLRRTGRDCAILYEQMPEARAARAIPHWTCYISVEDAAATAARAADLGGAAVFRAPFDVLDAGRVAAIRDPAGALVSLWQPRSRIGATLVGEVGTWAYNELATTDLERVKSFFAKLLGWTYASGGRGETLIIDGGRTDGVIRPGAELRWLPYFTVENVDDTADRAERIGGRRLAPAELTDPLGAAFGVCAPGMRTRDTTPADLDR